MPKGVSVVGSTVHVTCDLHESPIETDGSFIEGSSNFSIGGKGVVLLGHKANLNCGHQAELISGSNNFTINGKSVGRIGDQVKVVGGSGLGTITSASTSFTNE